MEIPFITPAVFEGYYPINWYYQKEGFNGLPALLPTPGLLEWCNPGYSAEVRGTMKLTSTVMYSVIGNRVYRHGTNASYTQCTGALLTSSGPVQMATNGTYMMIIDSTYGYYVTGTTLTRIADTDFPTSSSLTFQDGYFIVTAKNTGRFYISGLNDPSAWNPLDYVTSEGLPDNSVRAFMDHRELLNFQEESTEPYQNTGNADFPFQRIEGAFIECGLCATNSVAKANNSVLWLADDFTIKSMTQYTPSTVSPENLNRIIGKFIDKPDCIAFTYKDSGNTFYVISWKSDDKTYAVNTATGAWHQWASGMSEGRHRANCHCFFGGKNLVGDYDNGKIYELSNTTYTDDGETIRRRRVSPPLYDTQNRNRLTYPRLEIKFKSGVGLPTGQGSNPQAMLRYSDDDCRTWSNERWAGIGQIGAYRDRAIWDFLGSSRIRNFELVVTDPIDATVIGAYSPVRRNAS